MSILKSKGARRGWQLAYPAQLGLMLAPYLLGAVVLSLGPAAVTFVFAFLKYDALSAPVWYGLRNFQLLQLDPRLPAAVSNSLVFVLLAVPVRTLAALALALWLHRPGWGVKATRAAVCFPTVIPEAAYALVWLWILNPFYGPLNLILNALGWPAPAWLVNPLTAKPALALAAVFQIGEGFVALLAARQSVPPVYYDVARVDGGGGGQLFRYITWPYLRPWLVLLVVRDLSQNFQNTFVPALLMTGGGPYYATFFLPMLIYDEAFDGLRLGLAAAATVGVVVITLALTGLVLAAFRGWNYVVDL